MNKKRLIIILIVIFIQNIFIGEVYSNANMSVNYLLA